MLQSISTSFTSKAMLILLMSHGWAMMPFIRWLNHHKCSSLCREKSEWLLQLVQSLYGISTLVPTNKLDAQGYAH
jgi:hypothetical protein